MIVSIRQEAPSVGASILLVVAAEQVSAPAPLLGSDHQRRRIDHFDLAGVIEDLILDFVHGRARRMDITMGRVPYARLVIENVVPQSAVCVCAPAAHQVLNPTLLK